MPIKTNTSPTFSTNNQYIKYRIVVTENSINIANNTSNITVQVQAWRTNTGYSTSGTGTCYCNIDGTQYTASINSSQQISYNSYTVLLSKTLNIPHNDNGSKNITVSSYITHSSFSSSSQGFNVVLTSIQRQATITSAPNFTDEENPTITYTNAAGANVSSLQACISLDGSADDIPYRDISKDGSSYSFNLSNSERQTLLNACTNSKTLSVIFYVKTVISGTTFYSTLTRTMTIINAKPTIASISYRDINSATTAITQNNQQIIRNKSTLQVTLNTLTALKGAALSSATININGNIQNFTGISGTSISSKTLTFGNINVSSNIDAIITLTDSRGFSTTYTKAITVLNYFEPYSNLTLQRQNNYYTETNLNVDCTYASLDSKNSVTIQYQTKKVEDASYGSLTNISNNTPITINLDNAYQWNVRVVTTDALGTTVSYILFLDKGIPPVFVDRLLNSVGVNCFPTHQNSLEVNGTVINGVVLYSNSSGSNSTITLSESAANFTYMKIYYKDSWNQRQSCDVINPNSKYVSLISGYPIAAGTGLYLYATRVYISGSTIEPRNYNQTYLTSSSTSFSATNQIYILKVEGY